MGDDWDEREDAVERTMRRPAKLGHETVKLFLRLPLFVLDTYTITVPAAARRPVG
jgi:hypothetical protein